MSFASHECLERTMIFWNRMCHSRNVCFNIRELSSQRMDLSLPSFGACQKQRKGILYCIMSKQKEQGKERGLKEAL